MKTDEEQSKVSEAIQNEWGHEASQRQFELLNDSFVEQRLD